MAKDEKKTPKEASKTFHDIMKASVKNKPTMLYKVIFEDGEPVSAQEYIPTAISFPSGQLFETSNGKWVYTWRIVYAVSEGMAMKIAKT